MLRGICDAARNSGLLSASYFFSQWWFFRLIYNDGNQIIQQQSLGEGEREEECNPESLF